LFSSIVGFKYLYKTTNNDKKEIKMGTFDKQNVILFVREMRERKIGSKKRNV
jgi:hypothetical protein